jgi:hypothetical protein
MIRLAILFQLACITVQSQVLIDELRVEIKTAGGLEVQAYASMECRVCYYYLPVGLRLSRMKNSNVPQISLLTWKDDETSNVSGGILHLLLEWGLNAQEENEVKHALRLKRDTTAVLIGPAMVFVSSGLAVSGKDHLAFLLRKCLTSESATAAMPGSAMAMSFRFSENEIDDFLQYKRNPGKSTAALEASYKYEVMTSSGSETRNVVIGLPFSQILNQIKE